VRCPRDDLQPDAVRVFEERRVVVRVVFRVPLRRRGNDPGASEPSVRFVDGALVGGLQTEVMEAGAIRIEPLVRTCQPDRDLLRRISK
jgi:hypothetical protein